MSEREFTWFFVCVIVAVVGFIALFAAAIEREAQNRQAIIDKCNSTPELFECQLYLAESGRQAIRSAAESGALTGGMVGGMIGGSVRAK